jgi:CheY-like chemotaxis protein
MSLKIMVVDDEPQSLKVMRALAVPLGHMVFTFEDSQEAIQRAQKQQFDAVFLGMPRPDGLELVLQIGDSESSSEATVVMLNASEDIEAFRSAFRAGAKFVLPKPIAASRIIPLLTAMESPEWKARRHTARLPLCTGVNCKWGDQDFPMLSRNISETGMLLQSQQVVEVGQEVSLEFEIAHVGASLNVRARIVRKEGTELLAIEFIELPAEHQNAIQLYIMGRLNRPKTPRVGPNFQSLWTS